jgi:acetylornithine deacetylase/succinyl-diaminopimelate desuccinylase-like protein
MWPGRPVIPFLKRGASDSLFLRAAGIPTYGIPPIPMSEPDYEREHGIDERLPVASLRAGVEFNHRLALEIAGR